MGVISLIASVVIMGVVLAGAAASVVFFGEWAWGILNGSIH